MSFLKSLPARCAMFSLSSKSILSLFCNSNILSIKTDINIFVDALKDSAGKFGLFPLLISNSRRVSSSSTKIGLSFSPIVISNI